MINRRGKTRYTKRTNATINYILLKFQLFNCDAARLGSSQSQYIYICILTVQYFFYIELHAMDDSEDVDISLVVHS